MRYVDIFLSPFLGLNLIGNEFSIAKIPHRYNAPCRNSLSLAGYSSYERYPNRFLFVTDTF